MDRIPYEERVRRIAKEMAKKDYDAFLGSWRAVNELPTWEDQPHLYKSGPIQSKMSDAEVAVAKMAEAVKEGVSMAFEAIGEYPADKVVEGNINNFVYIRLIEYGLIPDKTGAKDAL